MMLTCKELSQLASQGLDRRLGPVEKVKFRLHLAVCNGCRNFTRQLDFLRKATARLGQ
jgi:hypothetical protein